MILTQKTAGKNPCCRNWKYQFIL